MPSVTRTSWKPRKAGSLAGVASLMRAFLLQGCAVHHRDVTTGSKRLWGLGQLQLESKPAGTNPASVTVGAHVPSLCLRAGRWQVGVSVGLRLTAGEQQMSPNMLMGYRRTEEAVKKRDQYLDALRKINEPCQKERMNLLIPHLLSSVTKPLYEPALKQVEKPKQKGGKIGGLRLSDDGPGNPAGIIVVDEPI